LISSVNLPVRTYPSAKAFLDAYRPNEEGCVVVDVRMPGMSGLELQRKLAEMADHVPVIIITGHGDIHMAVDAMKAGAFDFIEKPFDEQLLLDLVQKAVERSAEAALYHALREEVERRLDLLTPREGEVLDLIMAGEPNKRIALTLGICEKTVEAHRAKVMEKTQARSVADLIKMVITANGSRGNPQPPLGKSPNYPWEPPNCRGC
jgi:FixJ family two-component response regulator